MKSHVLLSTAWLDSDGMLFYELLLFEVEVIFVFVFRAPVLVAIALIEYGFDAISAVTFIRERR
jgi:hypothetical protein